MSYLMKWWGMKMGRTHSPTKAIDCSTAVTVSHGFKILLITSLSVSNLELNSTKLLINTEMYSSLLELEICYCMKDLVNLALISFRDELLK